MIAAHESLGFTYEKIGEIKSAIDEYKQAIKLVDQPNWERYYLLARALANNGDFEEAITHYNMALEINDEEALIYYALAKVMIDDNSHEKSLENLRLPLEYLKKGNQAKYYTSYIPPMPIDKLSDDIVVNAISPELSRENADIRKLSQDLIDIAKYHDEIGESDSAKSIASELLLFGKRQAFKSPQCLNNVLNGISISKQVTSALGGLVYDHKQRDNLIAQYEHLWELTKKEVQRPGNIKVEYKNNDLAFPEEMSRMKDILANWPSDE